MTDPPRRALPNRHARRKAHRAKHTQQTPLDELNQELSTLQRMHMRQIKQATNNIEAKRIKAFHSAATRMRDLRSTHAREIFEIRGRITRLEASAAAASAASASAAAASATDATRTYKIIMSQPHVLTINGQQVRICGKNISTGEYSLPANEVNFSLLCNLTEMFFIKHRLFSAAYDASDVFQRVRNFMERHRDEFLTKHYFLAAINKNRPSGANDLPNVNAAVVAWLLQNLPRATVFMDPIDFLKNPLLATTTKPIKLTNFSEVVRYIKANVAKHIPIDTSMANIANTASSIRYQRGKGTPSAADMSKIRRDISDESASLLQVMLTPGKYDYVGSSHGAPKMCYKEFRPSVAHLINQYTHFNEYLQLRNKTALRKLYLVMDEFSGYSMFTIAAIIGFGLERITTVLCYYNGNYACASIH